MLRRCVGNFSPFVSLRASLCSVCCGKNVRERQTLKRENFFQHFHHGILFLSLVYKKYYPYTRISAAPTKAHTHFVREDLSEWRLRERDGELHTIRVWRNQWHWYCSTVKPLVYTIPTLSQHNFQGETHDGGFSNPMYTSYLAHIYQGSRFQENYVNVPSKTN